jgi:hypothetical protein
MRENTHVGALSRRRPSRLAPTSGFVAGYDKSLCLIWRWGAAARPARAEVEAAAVSTDVELSLSSLFTWIPNLAAEDQPCYAQLSWPRAHSVAGLRSR